MNEQISSHQKLINSHNIKHDIIIGLGSFLVFISSLTVNFLQLINYLIIGFISIRYYRKINCYLQYIIWGQVVAIAEWWSHSTITFFYGDEESKRLFGTEHCLGVSNHRYELDGVFLWMACDKVHCLGSSKAFGKKELKYVPIVGWTFFLGEYIFLERNWEKDSKNISPALDKLMAYEDTVLLLIAAEGTRFTEEKYKASLQFAKDKGLKVHYKHHLLPRIKGFAHTVKHLKEKYPNYALYNIQMAFDEETNVEINVSNFIRGLPMNGDMYIKRIPISSVPTNTDEEITNFLYDLYNEKDKLMEYHKHNGLFPGIAVSQKRRLLPLIMLFTNFFITAVPLAYILFKVFSSNNWISITLTSLFIIIVYVALYFAIRSAKINKGSKYGTFEGKSLRQRLDSRSEALRNGLTNGNTKVDNKKLS